MNREKYSALVELHREEILAAERYIWSHPETGFKEWGTHAYLANIFEKAGYELTCAGDIPGFYTDIDTGRPGPKVLIFCELDALCTPNHFDAVDGMAHACGHNAQCAAMVGMALALKEPGALDGLCGSIRLMAVPAEELIELEYREELRKKGTIHYLGGKPEFIYRGYMDGVDLSYMFHTGTRDDIFFHIQRGNNGCVLKTIDFQGVASHAGDCPELGVNALYAATLCLNGINALRETFSDGDHVRVHPIMTRGGESVSIVPAAAELSTYVRGSAMENIRQNARKVDRAAAGAALAMGGGVTVSTRPGYVPNRNSVELNEVALECMQALCGDKAIRTDRWGTGCTDMGDMSSIMPSIHPYIHGSRGKSHGDDYRVADPEVGCILSAKGQLLMLSELLSNGAEKAKAVIAAYHPDYASREEYVAAMDALLTDRELVSYTEAGADVHY